MELTGFDIKYEKPVCKQHSCIGCRQIDDCADAIRHIKNTLKDRVTGKISHEELMDRNRERLGTEKERVIHWTDLIGDQREIIDMLAHLHPDGRQKAIDKMTQEGREKYIERIKTLNHYGWFAPELDHGQLTFSTINKPHRVDEYEDDDLMAEGDYLK